MSFEWLPLLRLNQKQVAYLDLFNVDLFIIIYKVYYAIAVLTEA